ncbi:Uncharacterized conserved protein, DUF2236 family [Haloechinothrix alba]|uniref:Uncharacterized conserved protein, DUF2236 family n=1 Tax=Haloechinothrix alba TaxID=664784 RepID=A0A238X9P1_9PSEU|nr:oxygenase MpaB family protein [Haloechinothrix alba]SNR54569.1 Uncharacterized conserved protein, DUF2236 family [Haloechinothrix alba]
MAQHDAPAGAHGREDGGAQRAAPEPLGPESLTWRYFGDWRGILLALWAGSMQNMHPQLGAGVEEHSQFFTERFARLFRSLYPIYGVVYDGDRAATTAREVRGYHTEVSGVDRHGRQYHALTPETYYWAHATFFMGMIVFQDRLGEGLSEEAKRTLYEESVRWYGLYGMSMRPVPADWDEFRRYWEHMCTSVLEVNNATRDVLDLGELSRPPALWWLPERLWRVLRLPVARGFTWLTVGLYHPAVRERLGYRWGRGDEVAFRIVGAVTSACWKLVPFEWRYHPRARAAWRRARRAQTGTGTVETPYRNLPPRAERDSPKHYSPPVEPASRGPSRLVRRLL